MFDLIHEIAQTIKNNKLRTFLTGLSVAWGVFMLVVLLGAVRGVKNAMEDMFASTPTNVLTIWPGKTTMGYKGYQSGRFIDLKESDIKVIENSPVNVSLTGVKQYARTAPVKTEKDYVSSGIEGVYPQTGIREKINKNIKGRFINNADIESRRKVVVLPEMHVKTLFSDTANVLGKTVKIMDLAWIVVGTYTHEWQNNVFVPYTTLNQITGGKGNVDQMEVYVEGLKNEKDGEEAERQIRKTLSVPHEFNPEDLNAVWINNRFVNYLSNQKAMGYMGLAGWVIGILTLLSGIIGVSNIMFVSVKERTHEIGVRRAIGAKPRSIIIQVLAESVSITAMCGYAGIVLGMIVLQILNAIQGNSAGFKNPTLDLSIAIEVTVALIIAGALAGLFPALKAIKVKPVEALRDE